MKKISYIGMVDGCPDYRFTNDEIRVFLHVFETSVRSFATSRSIRSVIELNDFETANEYGLGYFTLTLERHNDKDKENWWGTFQYGSKQLKIIGAVEQS